MEPLGFGHWDGHLMQKMSRPETHATSTTARRRGADPPVPGC